MSKHPPQTYSRLFRPWDSNIDASTSNEKPPMPPQLSVANMVKNECEAPTVSMPTTPTTLTTATPSTSSTSNWSIKSERSSFSGNESDRECTSSSSCQSSYEDSFNGSSTPTMEMRYQMASSTAPSPQFNANALYANSPLLPPPQQQNPMPMPMPMQMPMPMPLSPQQVQPPQQIPFIPTNNELYYAAAVAAAGAIGNAPAAAAAAAFGLDPYTYRLVERECVRIVSEDAQYKSMGGRKQRPKKFKCPHCDVAFSNNGQLRGHIRIHTGERPFKCDTETCGKTFTRNEELTRHKRIHTGLRPFPCTACGKRFGRRDHLKKHMKTHMPQTQAILVYPYMYSY